MKPSALDLLVCPACADSLELVEPARDGREIREGGLRCGGCGALYPVTRGVPRMNHRIESLDEVARAFSYEWDAHHAGALEDDRDTLFGLTEAAEWARFQRGTALADADIPGLRVLDAGCGAARLSRMLCERGAASVVALDMSETVDGVYARFHGVPTLHVVQGNLMQAPVPPRAFDLVWSQGVIHHTPDAAAAFRALTRHVEPGGLLFVWVYPDRINPFRWTKRALDRVGLRRLSEANVMRLARALAYPSLAALALYRLVRRLPGLRPHGEWARSTAQRRGLRSVQLTWNDALAPPYNSWHTDEEVVGWFRAAGFTDVAAVAEPKVGVRGRAPGRAGAEAEPGAARPDAPVVRAQAP
jgi:SAM-dependent methyltransferase